MSLCQAAVTDARSSVGSGGGGLVHPEVRLSVSRVIPAGSVTVSMAGVSRPGSVVSVRQAFRATSAIHSVMSFDATAASRPRAVPATWLWESRQASEFVEPLRPPVRLEAVREHSRGGAGGEGNCPRELAAGSCIDSSSSMLLRRDRDVVPHEVLPASALASGRLEASPWPPPSWSKCGCSAALGCAFHASACTIFSRPNVIDPSMLSLPVSPV